MDTFLAAGFMPVTAGNCSVLCTVAVARTAGVAIIHLLFAVTRPPSAPPTNCFSAKT